MRAIHPTTPAPVSVWRRFLWVGLGAGTIIVAALFARIMTPDVPSFVDEDGFEYSEGGLFGNFFEALAWFAVTWIVLMIAATWFARIRSDNVGAYPHPHRTFLLWLGPVALVVFTVGLRALRTALGLDFLILGW